MARRNTASPTRSARLSAVKTETPRRGPRRASREAQNNPRPTPGRARGAAGQIDAETDTAAAAMAQFSNLVSAERDLADVAEEEGDEDTHAQLNDVAGRSQNSAYARRTAMSPAHSQLTGYNTTFSQAEVANLNADDVINNLENLNSIADGVLNLVTPIRGNAEALQDSTNGMLDVASRFYKNVHAKFTLFTGLQALYGSQTFIRPEHVIRLLLRFNQDEELLSKPWRPDEIFFNANLVSLLKLVFDGESSNRRSEIATSIDTQFPGFSMNTLVYPEDFRDTVGESQLVVDTWNTAIEIRTQMYVLFLEEGYEGPLLDTPDFVFAADSGDKTIDFDDGTRMRRFDDAITSQDDDGFKDLLRNRVDEIKSILERYGDDSQSAILALKEVFPWGNMCFTLVHWIQQRFVELRRMLQLRGGVDSIVESLQSEVDALDASTDPRLRPSQVGAAGTQPTSYVSASNIAALKARRERMNITASPRSQPSQTPDRSAQFMAQQAGAHLQQYDEEEVARQLESFSRSKRFIDQQHGAQRVTFVDTQDSQAPQSSRAFNPSSSRKRPAEDDADFDPSQDEGFQTDPRIHNVPVRTPRAVMSSGSNLRNALPRTSLGAELTDAASSPKRERKNPGRSIGAFPEPTLDEDGLPVATQHQQYLQANFMAKQRTAQAMRPARTRTKFSQEEEERVLELIGELGVQFALIKKQDLETTNALANRTAEDIRFKARNMKLDFLKAGVPLPPGFEYVRIDRKGVEQLERLGIQFEQEPMRSTNQLL